MARRKRNILKQISAKYQRKATNAKNQLGYLAMWGQEPPKKYKKC